MNAMAEVRLFPTAQFTQLETKFDAESHVLWGYMNPRPRACFTLQLLSELRGFVQNITGSAGAYRHQGGDHRIEYAVIASKTAGIFNLGGDLGLFRLAIANADRDSLIRYGQLCIDTLFPWSCNCELPLTTIALVQGDALGGGFECALASSIIVAEESARMGFPEILFNLFPGMGAYSFLARKVGRRIAEEMITSGNIYSGRQLYDLGVVDVLAPDGAGEVAVYGLIKKHSKAGNGRRALEAVRRVVNPVTYEELVEIVSIWADAALRLADRDLRMMDRLVRAQLRTGGGDTDRSDVCPVLPIQRCVS